MDLYREYRVRLLMYYILLFKSTHAYLFVFGTFAGDLHCCCRPSQIKLICSRDFAWRRKYLIGVYGGTFVSVVLSTDYFFWINKNASVCDTKNFSCCVFNWYDTKSHTFHSMDLADIPTIMTESIVQITMTLMCAQIGRLLSCLTCEKIRTWWWLSPYLTVSSKLS